MPEPTTRRITADEVRAAMAATGFRLAQGVTLDLEKKCGCPIGLVALATSGADLAATAVMGHVSMFRAREAIALDPEYAFAFASGFGGHAHGDIVPESYRLGHADGRVIRQALLPTEPTP